MAASLVQTSSAGVGGYPSANTSFSSTPTVGNVVFVTGFWNPTFGTEPTSISISDNQGNTYSAVVRSAVTQENGVFIGYCVIGTASGTFTVTATVTGGSADAGVALCLQEWSGMDTASLLDQSGSGTQFVNSSFSVSASGANSGDDRVVIAGVSGRGSDITPTNSPPDTGYTNVFARLTGSFAEPRGLASYKVVTASETSSADWGTISSGSGGSLAMVIATFAVEAGGGGGITGDLAVTESGSDTFAGAGDVIVQGALSVSETGSDTAALAGTVRVAGALAVTESGSDAASLAGAVRVAGALAVTESGSDTASLSGTVLVQGSLAVTEAGSDTFAGTGGSGILGSLSATESGADTIVSTGDVIVTGVMASTEADSDTAALSGVVLVQGALSVTEAGSDTFAGSGSSPAAVTGLMAAIEQGGDTASIVGAIFVAGSFAALEQGTDAAQFLSREPETYPLAGLAQDWPLQGQTQTYPLG